MKFNLAILIIISLSLFVVLFIKNSKASKSKTSSANEITRIKCFDTSVLTKNGEPLSEDIYWEIVNKCSKVSLEQQIQLECLQNEISKLSFEDMIGFKLQTDILLRKSYLSGLWCAGYIMNGGCSDDGFEYFRCWIISRGKDVFYSALQNPDILLSQKDYKAYDYSFEAFWYVANDVFEELTNQNLYDYIDEDSFNKYLPVYKEIDFDWSEDKPETMKKICPKLFNHFWK